MTYGLLCEFTEDYECNDDCGFIDWQGYWDVSVIDGVAYTAHIDFPVIESLPE